MWCLFMYDNSIKPVQSAFSRSGAAKTIPPETLDYETRYIAYRTPNRLCAVLLRDDKGFLDNRDRKFVDPVSL